ncbi:uncharacterized protein LOC120336690 [Styela clava]
MNYFDSLWEKTDAQLTLTNVTAAYENLKKELKTAWDSEDWQIKVLMIELVLVALLIILIFIAWKVNGHAISKLLTPDSKILESKLSKSRYSATTLNCYSRQNLKKHE